MDAGEETIAQQSLCLSCGICCDGTLFDQVPVKPADILSPLKSAGIKIRQKKNEKFFNQPCIAYRENCCQVYVARPAACQKYRCWLLKRYEDGKISRQDAEQKINKTLQLKKMLEREFAQIFPQGNEISLPAAKKLMPENNEMIADPALLKKWGLAMMIFSALLDCLRTNFRLLEKKDSILPDQKTESAALS